MQMSDVVFALLEGLVKAIIGLATFVVRLLILTCSFVLTAVCRRKFVVSAAENQESD
jgi:hypothetical protein